MLENVDSHEIGEWMAYERAHGPIDNRWRDAALIAIHHELRVSNRLFEGATWGQDGPLKESDWVELPAPETFLRTEEQRERDQLINEEVDEVLGGDVEE